MTGIGPPRRASGIVRYIVLALILLAVIYRFRPSIPQNPASAAAVDIPAYEKDTTFVNHGWSSDPEDLNTPDTEESAPHALHGWDGAPQAPIEPVQPPTAPEKPQAPAKPQEPERPWHPIDTLIMEADTLFQDTMMKESHSLRNAAAAYRTRRGRHPPPGFDQWYEHAKDNGALIVEDFFDQIYHDLAPFWGLAPATMRKESWDYEMNINIRNGHATSTSNWFWTEIWLNLTQSIEHMLPDMDIPLNAMDEPRILLPWEQVNSYMDMERKSKSMPEPSEVITTFINLPPPGKGDLDTPTRPKNFEEHCRSSSSYSKV